jgi:hypothetical protein
MSAPLQASTSEEDDAVALQVALAEAQLQARKHLAGNTADETSTTAALEHEVLYNNGATPLFTVIEERKWFDAMELLEVVPEQAATWVKSTGTENTTFGWSLWRRLPIHEVRNFYRDLNVIISRSNNPSLTITSAGLSSSTPCMVHRSPTQGLPGICQGTNTLWNVAPSLCSRMRSGSRDCEPAAC